MDRTPRMPARCSRACLHREVLLAVMLALAGCREVVDFGPRGAMDAGPTRDAAFGAGECLTSGDCATGRCEAGRCLGDTRCAPEGETCAGDADCCNGACDDGRCAEQMRCQTTGDACEGDEDCCSQRCGADARCVALGGCRPSGELCRRDADCCNFAVADGVCEDIDERGWGRCANPRGCAPPGEVCAVDGAAGPHECCDEPPAAGVCGPSGVAGVERCRASIAGCGTLGAPCAVPADCCSGRCRAEIDGYRCGE